MERLFSVAGQIASDKRSGMLPDNLEKVLFLRENILILNFVLDWVFLEHVAIILELTWIFFTNLAILYTMLR